jgi:hypothetical protein
MPKASIICTSESAIDGYLAFGLAEAKALIIEYRAAVLAIAEALMIRRTLDDAQEIDTIIATAPALARRADWVRVIENAACFTQAHPELGDREVRAAATPSGIGGKADVAQLGREVPV